MPFNLVSIPFSQCLLKLAACRKKTGGRSCQTIMGLALKGNSVGLGWGLGMPIFNHPFWEILMQSVHRPAFRNCSISDTHTHTLCCSQQIINPSMGSEAQGLPFPKETALKKILNGKKPSLVKFPGTEFNSDWSGIICYLNVIIKTNENLGEDLSITHLQQSVPYRAGHRAGCWVPGRALIS